MKRLKLWQKLSIGSVLLLVAAAVLGLLIWHWGRVHKHCIKLVGMSLNNYAAVNAGQFPFHTNGYPQALVKWARFEPWNVPSLVGVDDDGSWLTAAVTAGVPVNETNCTRIYVQGLSTTSDPRIAVLFDRYAVKGGDHFRGVSGQPFLREACLVDGSHEMISVARWPAFASNQVELLVQAGIPRVTAEDYYRPTLDPNARR